MSHEVVGREPLRGVPNCLASGLILGVGSTVPFDSASFWSQHQPMLSKIVIRNVGVLRAFDTFNAPKLDKLTLVYGRNGRGKSTLTSVLRAARDGEAATVLGRKSLGNGGAAPEVVLVAAAGNVIFKNGAWNTKGAPVEVFDTTFITDNVYAGELIDLGLLRFPDRLQRRRRVVLRHCRRPRQAVPRRTCEVG